MAGKARRRVAAELIADLERIHARKEAADKVLRELGPRPAEACWICTASDPRVQPDCWGEVGDITRFPDRGHFASWSATAPIDASSGDHVATTARRPPESPPWKPCAASNADCLTSSTARCWTTPWGRAREGTGATTRTPARPAHNPSTGSSDKPLRGLSTTGLNPLYRRCVDTEGSHERTSLEGGW